MDRAFVITGLVFMLSLVLVIATNYLILSSRAKEVRFPESILLDKVFNRHIDTYRIIDAAIDDGLFDGTDCLDKKGKIDMYTDAALGDPLLSSESIIVSYTKTITDTCGGDNNITIEIDYIVETDDNSVHKEVNFARTVYAG